MYPPIHPSAVAHVLPFQYHHGALFLCSCRGAPGGAGGRVLRVPVRFSHGYHVGWSADSRGDIGFGAGGKDIPASKVGSGVDGDDAHRGAQGKVVVWHLSACACEARDLPGEVMVMVVMVAWFLLLELFLRPAAVYHVCSRSPLRRRESWHCKWRQRSDLREGLLLPTLLYLMDIRSFTT